MLAESRRCAARGQTTLLAVAAAMQVWIVYLKSLPERPPSPGKLGWSKPNQSIHGVYTDLPPRRIRNLETHVADIKATQSSIQNTLLEIVSHLRGTGSHRPRSPSAFSQHQYTHSPTTQSSGSPSMPAGANGSHVSDHTMAGSATPTTFHGSVPPMLNASSRHSRGANSQSSIATSSQQQIIGDYHPPQLPPSHISQGPGQQPYGYVSPSSGAVLPPFSSIGAMATSGAHGHIATRYPTDVSQRFHSSRNFRAPTPSSSRRALPSSSNVTSADSSDVDDEENGELPASGLVAPWEVLRGLADVAIERANKVCMI